MLVITAMVGQSMRNDRSLSSASATMYSPRPSRALLPNALSRPPITAVGSTPARSSTSAIIEVVVVLPCEPATAIENRSRISSASISARGITGMPRRAASTISGFDARTADENTTTSASATCAAVVALVHPDAAHRLQPACRLRLLRVGSAHLVPEVGQQLGDAAHADAADADEVHPLRAPEHPRAPYRPCVDRPSRRAPRGPASSSRRSTITFAASGFASRRAAAPMRAPLRRRRRPAPAIRAASPLGGQRTLLDHRRGALSHQRLGVAALVIVGGGRQRNQNRRPARRGQLRQRRRAGATHHEVGRLHLAVHREQKRLHPRFDARLAGIRRGPCPRPALPSGA